MPLMNCPACDKRISTTATSCPNCGHIMKIGSESGGNVMDFLITVVVGGGAIIVVIAGLIGLVKSIFS